MTRRNDMDNYQAAAMSFRLPSADPFYAVLGLAEEAGEVCGKVGKVIRDGFQGEDGVDKFKEELKKELGDVLWMLAAVAADNELSLGDVAQNNLDKLFSRQQRNVIQGSGDNR